MQVMVRVRPTNQREIELAGEACSLQERGSSSLHLRVGERTYDFKFDELLGHDGSQEELFQRAELSPLPLGKYCFQVVSCARDATSTAGTVKKQLCLQWLGPPWSATSCKDTMPAALHMAKLAQGKRSLCLVPMVVLFRQRAVQWV